MVRHTALIVDDDRDFRESLGLLVGRGGFEVHEASSLEAARARIAQTSPDVVLLDLQLPDGEGIELLRDSQVAGGSEFIVITGNATVESAVSALREGALDYLTKPIERARLESILANVSRTRELKSQLDAATRELRDLGRFGKLVGNSPVMQHVYDLVQRVAPSQASVMLTGESGTGKELAAETVHRLSRRREGPFLAVNCGAISETIIESELFGHEKGSFTGAERARRGYFEQANGGTLLLDEVTEMPIELQVKLLRVLETGTILRVGGSETIPVDVRVIAATNRDPAAAVRDNQLREDLYYRLNVFPIHLPPLRDRGKDVELLAEYFLDGVNTREETDKRLSPEARQAIRLYAWPGNVRELKNAVERAAILADSVIGPEIVASSGAPTTTEVAAGNGSVLHVRVGASLDDVERRIILATLQEYEGDKKRTAETLGISLKTLYTRLNLYDAASRASRGGVAVG